MGVLVAQVVGTDTGAGCADLDVEPEAAVVHELDAALAGRAHKLPGIQIR